MTDLELDEFGTSIAAAETHDELRELEGKLRTLKLDPERLEYKLLSRSLESRRELLEERGHKEVAIARVRVGQVLEGTVFEDANNLYTLRAEPIPAEEAMLKKSLDLVFRKETPEFYVYIKEAAEKKGDNGSLQQICTESLGSNSAYPKGDTDIFGRPIDPVRAHIFLDSKTCGPPWGHMTEGATGGINADDDNENNHVRVLRMMGGEQNENSCLRRDIHNFVTLHNDHRFYYDGNPQLMLVPILPLDKILSWEENDPYDVLVFVASPHETVEGFTCADIYKAILSHFPWDHFYDETKVGTHKEIEGAFEVLRHFIKALAHSLMLGIPQQLLELAATGSGKKDKNKDSDTSSLGQSPSPSVGQEEDEEPTKEEWTSRKQELEKAREALEKEMKLYQPFYKETTKGLRPVLKLRFEGKVVADPWLLMVKAAVNFSWIAYGFRLLPACLPPPDHAVVEYEEALLEYEERRRKSDVVPTTFTIPAVTSNDGDQAVTVTPPGALTPPAKVPPSGDREGGEETWETLSDSS